MRMTLQTTFRAAGVAMAVAALASCSSKPASITDIRPDDMTLGSPTAKVTMVEYASVACPICGNFEENLWPQVKAKYVDTGLVRYVYRPMPMGVPTIAMTGELLAQCSGKDKYFNVVEAIMRGQEVFYKHRTVETDAYARPVLLDIAKSVGMSEDDFNKCVTNSDSVKKLQSRFDTYERKDNVYETPTFFINGKKLDRTKGDISDFDAALQPLLKAQ